MKEYQDANNGKGYQLRLPGWEMMDFSEHFKMSAAARAKKRLERRMKCVWIEDRGRKFVVVGGLQLNCPDCGGNCDAILAALQKAQVALDHSVPKMVHYPEPVQRHKEAVVAVTKVLDQLAMTKEKPGVVCGDCGRTVTEGEYSYGQSSCCKKFVVPEEQYGK